MNYVFTKSARGYAHKKRRKPCQDFSASYKDSQRTIITCCDGHGGDIYIRSKIGSRFASEAVINSFNSISLYSLSRTDEKDLINKIKLDILCKWNENVSKELKARKLRTREYKWLDTNTQIRLKSNPIKAFGTTLTGAMVIKDKLIVVGIGDSEVIGCKDGKITALLADDNDPAANITYSMCQDDAFNYLRVKILDWNDYDCILLCSDGLSSPYQSYDNFNNSFIKRMIFSTLENRNTSYTDKAIDDIANTYGVGDDVTLSFILKDTTQLINYK